MNHLIYHLFQHRNLIVELPREVTDISPYLGRHLHATFLLEGPLSEDFSEIYEYKYSRHGDPATKNWSVEFPKSQKIPEGFFRTPYPLPIRASDRPPIDIADYAYPIPNDVYIQRQVLVDEAIAAAAVASTSGPTPPKFSFIRDEPQPNNVMDNTASTSRLPGNICRSTLSLFSDNGSEVPEKQASSLLVNRGQTETLLASIVAQSCVNEEESAQNITEGEQDDYNPSAELLAMLADLPPELNPLRDEQGSDGDVGTDIMVKPEPVDDALPGISSFYSLSTLSLSGTQSTRPLKICSALSPLFPQESLL
ncbi:hypothetical protein HYPSUDRAFT_815524 [Hypholoma sublateritium FD-334 SS-4]|uniref:Uncharacterized protein n=1 Tax=Hypholoma sublateritium (strain FD-334 SS-4) TaxID=945553 RepID=A0A0D2PKJ3_HYPSF|nr:hypothetical protein HYPSUDRAFT_815524 [Hypholoma sublateritium FD-334 SS-4]